MNGTRPVVPEEVALKIDEEVKLICTMASHMLPSVDSDTTVRRSYEILDKALLSKAQRTSVAMETEIKRRRGY